MKQAVFEKIEELGKFFLFRRKRLALDLASDINQLYEERDQLRKELKSSTDANRELTETLETSRIELTNTTSTLQAKTTKLQALERELEDVQSTLNNLKLSRDKLQKDLKSTTDANRQLTEDLENTKIELTNTTSALQEKTTKLEALERELEETQATLSNLELERDQLRKELKSSTDANRELTETLETSRIELTNTTSTLEEKTTKLEALERELEEAQSTLSNLKLERDQLQKDLKSSKDANRQLTEDLDNTKIELTNTTSALQEKTTKLEALERELEEAQSTLANLKLNRDKLQTELKSSKYANSVLLKDIDRTKLELNNTKEELREALREKGELNGKLSSKRKELALVKEDNSLIEELLAAKPKENPAYAKFRSLCENEFFHFANEECSLHNEAYAVLKLQSMLTKLNRIVQIPSVYNKTVVAVGGGFSSGKSEFISAQMRSKVMRLPIGLAPTTAVPTYITHSDSDMVKVFSITGGSIPISVETYRKLTHDKLRMRGFNLREIMPKMSVETKLKYKDVCFVDTPGYNAPNSGQRNELSDSDFRQAKLHLENADILIWLIGMKSSPTIKDSDICFLEDLKDSVKEIYIVANQADTCDEYRDAMDSTMDLLELQGIEIQGICAYDSLHDREIGSITTGLGKYLKKKNTVNKGYSQTMQELCEILDMYENALKEDVSENTGMIDLINAINIDEMRMNIKNGNYDFKDDYFGDPDNSKNVRMGRLEKRFCCDELTKQLNRLGALRKEMIRALQDIFENL